MGTGVYAAVVIAASNVGYSDNNDLGADNVQDAIDKLNTKATIKVKEAKEGKADLDSLTLTELKAMAKDKAVKGYSTMKKADLIAALK